MLAMRVDRDVGLHDDLVDLLRAIFEGLEHILGSI
jgi:hypothetical protein